MVWVVHSIQGSVLVTHFRVLLKVLCFDLTFCSAAIGANETDVALTLAHDTRTVPVTIVWAFIRITNSYVAVQTTVSYFAHTPSSNTLATTHAIVRALLDFSFASFANVSNFAEASAKMALPAVGATSRARKFLVFHAIGTAKAREAETFS
jgi:hypothetical protein